MLEFEVKNQKLTRLDVVEPATDSEQYLKAKFTVKDADWNGKAKTAYFRLGDVVYKALLDNNMCIVPSEVLIHSESKYARTQGSKIFVSLVGEYSTTRITTNEVCVVLNTSGYSDALTPEKPTENEYQQILTQYANNEAAINEAKAECESAKADLVGVKNIFANAIKGNLSGAVVSADDVSPVEHNPVAWVHGKNLIPFPYARQTSTVAGGTFTQRDDGGVLVGGTPTDYSSIAIYDGKPLATKGKVTFSLHGEYTNVNGALVLYGESNNVLLEKELWYGVEPYTIDLDSYPALSRWLFHIKRGSNNVEMSGTIYPQIEMGEVATTYEKWVDPSTVTVRRCGKNLFDVGEYENYHVIGTGTTISNGVINGEVIASNGGHCVNLVNKLPNGKVGISFECSGKMPRIVIRPCNSSGEIITECTELTSLGFQYNSSYGGFFANTKKITLTIPEYVDYWLLGFVFPVTDTEPIGSTIKISNVQVELNDVTGYEKANIVDYIPSADGTVDGITSLSPNMTILTDTEGAVVECEYIKDTNKVIQKIADALNITI